MPEADGAAVGQCILCCTTPQAVCACTHGHFTNSVSARKHQRRSVACTAQLPGRHHGLSGCTEVPPAAMHGSSRAKGQPFGRCPRIIGCITASRRASHLDQTTHLDQTKHTSTQRSPPPHLDTLGTAHHPADYCRYSLALFECAQTFGLVSHPQWVIRLASAVPTRR